MARILLAEDDTSMREYLQRALQRVGYEVAAVGCGTEAMPLLEAERFDLLLTDIVMPEMDGIELAHKASAIDPSIRVMFITGFAAVALQGGRTAPDAAPQGAVERRRIEVVLGAEILAAHGRGPPGGASAAAGLGPLARRDEAVWRDRQLGRAKRVGRFGVEIPLRQSGIEQVGHRR